MFVSFVSRCHSSRPRRKQSYASVLRGVLGRQPLPVALGQVERQRADDLLRHVVLHGEYVGQVAIEPLRPQMAARWLRR